MSFEISTSWAPASDLKVSEADATLCKMEIKLGGRNVRQATERFGSETRARVAFAFD